MNFDHDPKMDPERANALRDLLMKQLREEPQRKVRRTRRRIVIGSFAGLLVVTGAATGATVILNSVPVSNTTVVHCFSSTDAETDGSYPGSSATIAHGTGPGRVSDALDLCTQMWREGVLSGNSSPTAPTHAPGIVPSVLQVCVLRDGSAAVIPSDNESICISLGLAPLEAER